jgi:hypothetical protein
MSSTLNLFNTIDSNGAIKFYEYNSSGDSIGDYLENNPTSQILFNNSGMITLDSSRNLVLKANSSNIIIKEKGTQFLKFINSSGDAIIYNSATNKDIIFKEIESGNEIMRIDTSAKSILMNTDKKICFTDNNKYISSNGSILFFESDGGLNYNLNSSSTLTVSGTLTFDVSSNIILDTGNKISMKTGNSYELNFSNNSGDWLIRNTTEDKDIIFNVNDGGNDTSVLIIDSSESKIGINTSTPQKKLEILDTTNSQLRLTHTNNSKYIDIKSTVTSLDIITPDVNGFIKFSNNNTGSISTFISTGNHDTIPFFAIGNVSNGSSANTSSNIENGFKFIYNTSGNFKIQRNYDGSISNDILTIKRDTGNIGIGTTNPSTRLEVDGELKSSSFTDGTTKIYSDSLNNVNYIQSSIGSFSNIYTSINFPISKIENNNTILKCNEGSNGSISFNIDNKNLYNLVSNNGNKTNLNFKSPDGTGNFSIGIDNNLNGLIQAQNGQLSLGANNNEIMRLFNNSGIKSVSIGTATAFSNFPLTVQGGIISVGDNSGLSFVKRDNVANILSNTIYSPQGDYRIQTHTNGTSDIFTIQKNTGNVGIGTTNPSYKLEVNGKIKGNIITDGITTLRNGTFSNLNNITTNKTYFNDIDTGSITNIDVTNFTNELRANKLFIGKYDPSYSRTYESIHDNSFTSSFNGSSNYYNIPNSNNKTYNSITTLYINYDIASDVGNESGLVYTTGSYKFGIQLKIDNYGNKFIPFVDTENPYNDWSFYDYAFAFVNNLPNNQIKGNHYEAIVEYDYSNSGSITISTYFKGDDNIYKWSINETYFSNMVIDGSITSLSLGQNENILLGRQDPANNGNGGNYFKGTISDFKIIEKSLTEKERNDLFFRKFIDSTENVVINKKRIYNIYKNKNKLELFDNQLKLFISDNITTSNPILLRTEQTNMSILNATPYLNGSRTDNNPSFSIEGYKYNYGFGTISFKLSEGNNYTTQAKKRYDITQDGKHIWYDSQENVLLKIQKEINSTSTNTAIYIGGDTAISSPETERYLRFNQSNVQLTAYSGNSLTFDATNYNFNTGNIGINTNSPDRKLDILDNTNPQLRLTHTDNSKYVDFKAAKDSNNKTYLDISIPQPNSFIKYSNSNNNAFFIGGQDGNNSLFFSVGNKNDSNPTPNNPNEISTGFNLVYNTSGNLDLKRCNQGFKDTFITFYKNKSSSIFINGYNNTTTPYYYGDFVIIQRNSTSYGPNNGGLRLIDTYNNLNSTWGIFANYAFDLNFNYNGNNRSYINDTGNNSHINFTGQHRSFINEYTLDELQNYEGLIVCADKDNYTLMSGSLSSGLDAKTINEALPDISLCTKENDKTVFGVLSNIEDLESRIDTFGNYHVIYEKENGDTRPYINSVGEGCIWVSNKNGPLESGDYITTSSIPGYGMKQENDLKYNYTVAKITQDCDFIQSQIAIKEILREEIQVEETKEITVKDENGDIIYDTDENGYQIERKETITETVTKQVNILDNKGFVQFVDTAETEDKYKLRYLLSNGTQITEEEYNTKISNNEEVYKAAFVGCTYHCG